MFDKDKVWFGITPTLWTNDDFPLLGDEIPFEQCVSEMALAGFQGCSVGHKFPTDREELRRQLALRGLRVSEPWASTFFTMNNMFARTVEVFREQMAFIQDMGGTDIVLAELGHAVHQQPVAPIVNKPVFNDNQWRAMVDGLNQLGRMAAERGMRLCYHHHIGTGVMSRADIDRLMATTDPVAVFLLLDTGHLYWAGDDPLDLAKAYADRIKHVHLKDIRPDVMERSAQDNLSFEESILEGVFTVPGDGAIEFKPILQVLADYSYEGWLTVEAEQDHRKAHPLIYAIKARAYLREITGL